MVMDPFLVERVEAALDAIRPAIALDGGAVDLIEITRDGVARLEMSGQCSACALSSITMKLGIERTLRERVPEITAIEAIGLVAPSWADSPLSSPFAPSPTASGDDD